MIKDTVSEAEMSARHDPSYDWKALDSAIATLMNCHTSYGVRCRALSVRAKVMGLDKVGIMLIAISMFDTAYPEVIIDIQANLRRAIKEGTR